MGTIVVAGALAQRPGRPGHAWVFLSYLLGFQRLGHEVLFIDRLGAATGADGPRDASPGAHPAALAASSPQARWLERTMSDAGLEGRYAVLLDGGEETLGMCRRQLRGELERASFLLNVNGFLDDEELLAAVPRRVYLDIDPGFAQIWEAEGLADSFAGHDDFVTVATNIGGDGCRVPTGGRRWISTLPPVLLDRWPVAPPGDAFTSVGSWRGPFAPVEHAGVSYGLRVHEFRRFLELPARVAAPFELALEIEPEDGRDLERLRAAGWKLLDPLEQLGDFAAYGRFVRSSMAEIAIAKGVYVGTRGGWFSDRSASYLASGKPVVAQDTGYGEALPTGRGLLCFADLDGAVAAAEEVRTNLSEHCAAARAIAEEHLDSGIVLRRLLGRLGV
jgi:hypothetical protein